MLRLFGLDPPGAEREAYSEAELKMLVHRSTEPGEIEADEREMLYKVFDFAEKEAAGRDGAAPARWSRSRSTCRPTRRSRR